MKTFRKASLGLAMADQCCLTPESKFYGGFGVIFWAGNYIFYDPKYSTTILYDKFIKILM